MHPCAVVDNIGLTCSVESMHTIAARRLSRRGTASRHHPHRTSSRRNKENGNGAHRKNSIGRTSGGGSHCTGGGANGSGSSAHHDEMRCQRKQRTVSFEHQQQLLQSPQTQAVYFASAMPNGQWSDGASQSSGNDLHNISAIKNVVAPTTSILTYMSSNDAIDSTSSYQMNVHFIPPRV